ncbi:MAG: hypothetical protein M1514_00125 [Patescibacteria group bacterium]|nr:hypothetical protein [Patescibacteria group bacterium]
MMTNLDLLQAIGDQDKPKVEIFLKKLLPHLDERQLVIVGSLTVRYHLFSHQIPFPEGLFNDLDIIVTEKEAVKTSVSKDFLIVHYHIYNPLEKRLDADRFYIALVDPETKIKTDIFDEQNIPAMDPIVVSFQGHFLNLRNLEDQLATTAMEACRPLINIATDQKHFETIELLGKIADWKLAEKYWQQKKINPFTTSLRETLAKANEYIKLHSEMVYDGSKKERKPYRCEYCVSVPDFPITPMEEVYRVLGYS